MKWRVEFLLPIALAGCGEAPEPVVRLATARVVAPPKPAAVTFTERDDDAIEGEASWYGDELAGRLTANGERYDPEKLTAAHRTLPLGSWLAVTAHSTGRTLVVRVNDRGPYAEARVLDLSKGAARELGMSGDGDGRVTARRVSLQPDEVVAFHADEALRTARRLAAIRLVPMPPANAGERHFVQLATFRSPTRAAILAKAAGAAAVPVGGLYVVRFGPFDTATVAHALQAAQARGYPEARILSD